MKRKGKRNGKRGIKPEHRAGVYILFAALSNLITQIDEWTKAGQETDDRVRQLSKALGFKLKMYYMNKSLVNDFDRDVHTVMKGLHEGHKTSTPIALAMRLIGYYLEEKMKPIVLGKRELSLVLSIEEELVEEPALEDVRGLMYKSFDTGDVFAKTLVRYVMDNYK